MSKLLAVKKCWLLTSVLRLQTPGHQKALLVVFYLKGVLVMRIPLILFSLFIFLLIIKHSGSNSSNAGHDSADAGAAFVMCKDFVEKSLKSPSTAKFPWTSADPQTTIKQTDVSTYEVSSYVDAENSFSAMIRTNYVCTIEYEGNDKWRLKDLNLLN